MKYTASGTCSVFHIWVNTVPSTLFDDCCLRKSNIFSIVTTSHTVTATHHLQQCTPLTAVTVYIPCCMTSSSNIIWAYVRTPNSRPTRRSSKDVFVSSIWTTLSVQKTHSTFARHVASSREVLIENTLKCPGAKTINVFRACLGAQLTICAQK